MSADGSKTAILAALVANAGIAVAKFVGAMITGSGSMLAESVHSLADTGNEALLLVGQNRAGQEPTKLHQFGHGRNRYFYSFVVALVLFSMGAMYGIYEGIHKIAHAEDLTSPIVAIVILVVAVVLEGFSFATAVRESAPLRGNRSWWRFIRTTRNPELPVVLLEDSGALVGLVIALAAIGLTMLTGNPVWDGIGTLCIGLLLGAIAVLLIVEMKSLLIGEGAVGEEYRRIVDSLVDGTRIYHVIHVRTEYLGPDELMVAAKVAIVPGLGITEIAEAIDAAEARVRAAVPSVDLMYLEPDLYRTQPEASTSS
ncbi:cation diffusion facilitator family transporter [Nocardia sp. alder85J]|uniref:cation diffusion facilitator family transporter n=1 Tax=Nocardia sp. alder85J TaxID=2862949 RepID=UPI001CD5BE5B|nr:cation diffusion facilitator family transporter [Nocardia sp. alder85J]MCX4092132.1 cation diffusion facilitator family transporter [Nocardia sp. alder85J]